MKLKIINKTGCIKINGIIKNQGSKNAMLNNLCLPILTSEECIIDNVPDISDIKLNIMHLEMLNATVKWLNPNKISIKCNNLINLQMDSNLSIKTTGSKFFIPLMVQKFGNYITGPSGGCNIGDRMFINYAKSLESFGISFKIIDDSKFYFYKINSFHNNITLPFPSFGLTVNAIFSSACQNKETIISNVCL